MVGQKIAATERFPRRWLYRIWGMPDIHTRQKWIALNTYISGLPDYIRFLDAGCGRGAWSLELAARHPSWTIVGIDKDGEAIRLAEQHRQALGIQNITFMEADFLDFHPGELFHIVLSVASAHYLVEQGQGHALFDQFRAWLQPGGRLVLLGPRAWREVPLMKWLPQPTMNLRDLYTHTQLKELCEQSQLVVEELIPVVFLFGVLAKQLDAAQSSFPCMVSKVLYPFVWLLSTMDSLWKLPANRSCFWILRARREPFDQSHT